MYIMSKLGLLNVISIVKMIYRNRITYRFKKKINKQMKKAEIQSGEM